MKKIPSISPLNNTSLADKVEERLKHYFKSNNLKAGDAIPREIDLAESLGVSRTVVREALLRLRTLGVIDSKKHRGMVLTQPDFIENFEKVIDFNLFEDQTLKDIYEFRLIVEMGISEVLFARKTAEGIEKLEKIVQKQEQEEKDARILTLQNEIEFHGTLYKMTGNKTLERFQKLLLPLFQFVNDKLLKGSKFDAPAIPIEDFVTHRDLLEILKNEDPDTFRLAMKKHLEPQFLKTLQPDFNPITSD